MPDIVSGIADFPGSCIPLAYYAGQVTVITGQRDYICSLLSGTIPPGLALPAGMDPTGYNYVISGVPTVAGVYSFVILITDSLGNTATVPCSINVQSNNGYGAKLIGIETQTLSAGSFPISIAFPSINNCRGGLDLVVVSAWVTGTWDGNSMDLWYYNIGPAIFADTLGTTPFLENRPPGSGPSGFGGLTSNTQQIQFIVAGSLPIDGTEDVTLTIPQPDANGGTSPTTYTSAVAVVAVYRIGLTLFSVLDIANYGGPDSNLDALPAYVKFSSGIGSTVNMAMLSPGSDAASPDYASHGGGLLWDRTGFFNDIGDTGAVQVGTGGIDGTKYGLDTLIGVSSTILTIGCAYGPASLGMPYTGSLSYISGTPPYVFTFISGTLPLGLSMDSTGNVTGTPLSLGTYNFVVGVVDDTSASVKASCSITVSGVFPPPPPPVFECNPPPPPSPGSGCAMVPANTKQPLFTVYTEPYEGPAIN